MVALPLHEFLREWAFPYILALLQAPGVLLGPSSLVLLAPETEPSLEWFGEMFELRARGLGLRTISLSDFALLCFFTFYSSNGTDTPLCPLYLSPPGFYFFWNYLQSILPPAPRLVVFFPLFPKSFSLPLTFIPCLLALLTLAVVRSGTYLSFLQWIFGRMFKAISSCQFQEAGSFGVR